MKWSHTRAMVTRYETEEAALERVRKMRGDHAVVVMQKLRDIADLAVFLAERHPDGNPVDIYRCAEHWAGGPFDPRAR